MRDARSEMRDGSYGIRGAGYEIPRTRERQSALPKWHPESRISDPLTRIPYQVPY